MNDTLNEDIQSCHVGDNFLAVGTVGVSFVFI